MLVISNLQEYASSESYGLDAALFARSWGDFLGSAWIQVSDQATCACALGFAVREAWSRFEGLILIPTESY